MEMNYKEIEFKPYNPAHNDITCEDGELEGPAGASAHGMEVKFALGAGQLVAVHQHRAIVYHEGRLMWADTAEESHIAEDDLEEIAEIPRPASVALMGDILITTGGGQLLYHRWKENGYVTLPQLPPLPKIEFGLLKEGEMADTYSIVVPATMVPSLGGNGMTDPHPSTNNTDGEDVSAYIDKTVDTLIRRAHEDKRSRGYFTAPFFVRYAVIDKDGNCLCMSPPVLMAGAVLPPCMEVSYTSKDEKNATMRARLNGCAYFSLMARAASVPQEWMSVIKSIDIYVSPQIPTWDSGSGYLCSYANVLGQVGGGSGHRGRDNSGSDDAMFAGHYSADGTNYIDHFTDTTLSQTQVWYVSPNAALSADIAAAHSYCRIASLTPGDTAAMTSFTHLPIEATTATYLESLAALPDAPESTAIFPDVIATLNGRLVAAGGSYALRPGTDPAVASAFSGNTISALSSPVTVSVFARTDSGELRRVSATYDSSFDFVASFPRFIYHPDNAAEMMIIERGSLRYRLPLSRHPAMSGVYWFGGLGNDCRPESDTDELSSVPECDRIPCLDRLWLSSPGSSCHFSMSQSMVACNSQIKAVSTSVMTPDLSAIGKYPVYIFADDGVWLAEYDSDRLRLCGSNRISGEVCVSADAVTPTDDGVIFATERSLLMLSGSKIKRLMSPWGVTSPPLPELPWLSSPSDVSPMVTKPVLAYDGAISKLIMADAITGITYLCDITASTAALWHKKVISLPLVPSRPLIQTEDGDVGYLAAQDTANFTGMILTRPIKLTKAFAPKIIRSITVWHSGTPDSIGLKVYGANSLSSWHLIASTGCHRAELPSRSRWRFIRLAVIPKAIGLSTEIFGAQLEWKDE